MFIREMSDNVDQQSEIEPTHEKKTKWYVRVYVDPDNIRVHFSHEENLSIIELPFEHRVNALKKTQGRYQGRLASHAGRIRLAWFCHCSVAYLILSGNNSFLSIKYL